MYPETCTSWSGETDIQSYAIDNGLRYFRLGGASESQSGYSDYATLDVTGGPSPQMYQQGGNNVFPNLSNVWHTAEFGVYGMCCSAKAVFSGNPFIVARLAVTTINHTKTKPECPFAIKPREWTGESNNLKLLPTSSKWPERNWPAILFTEGNPTTTPKHNCVAIPAE